MARFGLVDHCLEVGADLIQRETAEGVVDPEFENENVDPAIEMLRQTLQPASR